MSIKQGLESYSRILELTDLKRVKNSFESLSDDDREWLKRVHAKLGIRNTLFESMQKGVAVNQVFLNQIAQSFNSTDMDGDIEARVRILPWVVAREWASEVGTEPERNTVNGHILDAIFNKISNLADASILVPGSACGRLVYEIACMGSKTVVGIDFDRLKTKTAQLILEGNKFTIRPYVLETCNRESASDNVRQFNVPDVAIDKKILDHIQVVSSEFTDYSKSVPGGFFNGIATSFFLDTTRDIRIYLEQFARLLPSGGYWINCGPLQYHYESEKFFNSGSPTERELNKEEVVELVKSYGFEITDEKLIETEYLGNSKSLMSTRIKCLFFIARKL